MFPSTLPAPQVRALRPDPPAVDVAAGDTDRALIAAVRDGDLAAFGTLYADHVAAGYRLARQLNHDEADDLVAEAFVKVLAALRVGAGPHEAFRAYLLTTVRHLFYDRWRREGRVIVCDVAAADGVAAEVATFSDPVVTGLERAQAATAFLSLPPRWRAVLWRTEVLRQKPAQIAPLWGLSPNSVAALAYRAREGLRRAYLQAQVAAKPADQCRTALARLGTWTRGGLSKAETQQVADHLDSCPQCRAIAQEVGETNAEIAC